MSLSDVDATAPNIVDSFEETFAGRFDSIESALYGLVQLDDWEAELERWANERGIDTEAVGLNHEIIARQTREVYDLVEVDGAVFAFLK